MASTLRERMKRETNRALTRAAQDLVLERGLPAVTVDDIATAAGVSVRTFFNYFSCKEAAVVGIPKEFVYDVVGQVLARPVDEDAVEAMGVVLREQVRQASVAERWRIRSELVRREPSLVPHYLAGFLSLEEALVGPVAERMGVDPERDPSARMFVAAVFGAIRAGTGWWERSEREISLERVLDAAIESANGWSVDPA